MMHASRTAAAIAASVVAAGTALGTAGAAHAATGRAMIAGSRAPAATPGARVGAVSGSASLTVQVWLRPDIAGATRFADAVSTPGTAQFHHYLSPKEYTARFGPSTKQADAVTSWLAGQGMSAVQVSGQRDYVRATGPVSAVETAFGVRLNRYRVKDATGRSTVIRSNDRDASIPSSLAGDVLAVTGLNNSAPLAMHTATSTKSAAAPTCSTYWAQHVTNFKPAFRGLTKGSLPVCGYSANQLRAAYGATTKYNGADQTVAMIEVGTPTAMFDTLTDYAKQNHLPAPDTSQFRELVLGRGNDCGNAFDIEEQLDSESVYAMAPGANQLMVDGDSCDQRLQGVQALFDAELAPLTNNGNHPLASIESNSWGITGGETFPAVYANTAHSINLRATAEGVGMYFSSGDNPGISVPASDPYSLSVGGTTVGIGAGNDRLFETGWSNNDAFLDGGQWSDDGIPRDAAGGGTSLLYTQPSYQKHVVPASMSHVGAGNTHSVNRAVPDISADADPNTGILQGVIEPDDNGNPGKYQTFVDGGTSLAAPLVAGIVADAQQGQKRPFGFVNPLIYSLYGTGALHDALPVSQSTPAQNRAAYTPPSTDSSAVLSVFDSQLPAYTDQVTARGYDTMTGVGTPNGIAFILALRHAAG